MESLIKLSGNLVNHLLSGKREKLDKEYFYMFSLSKFILLKESILKKGKSIVSDTEVTTFYFDNDKNQKYIPVILELFDYIKKNGNYKIKSGERISLTKSSPEQNKLANALWVFNKLRDSIAHGKYVFDFKNECIVIDNYDPNNAYGLKCSIPLSLLNKVSFFIEEVKTTVDQKEMIIKYYKYLQSLAEKYDIDPKKLYEEYLFNLEQYKYIKYNLNRDKYKYNNNVYNYSYINNNIYNKKKYYDDKINYSYDSTSSSERRRIGDKYKDLTPEIIQKVISEMNLRELEYLIKMLVQYRPKNDSETELIYRVLSEYKFIMSHKEQLEKERDEYDKRTRALIKEMHGILGIEKKNNIMEAIPALYNYMCLSFSVEPVVDYSYLSTDGLDITFDDNYQGIINGINKKCEEFNLSLENLINQYNSHPNEQFRRSLMDKLSEFYTDIITRYNVRNKTITTSIRNSIEHGNYSANHDANVSLVDLPDQHDKNTIKFNCTATVESLYNFTNQINDSSLKDKYTLRVFFCELKKIIPEELYNDIFKRLNDLSVISFGKELDINKSMENMYYEAIANVIKASAIKRG